jgi:hypothetical protein
MLVSLKQIIVLPDAVGKHACECGHPEMRLLPDRLYHCPACGSEVLAFEVPLGRHQDGTGDAGVRVSG